MTQSAAESRDEFRSWAVKLTLAVVALLLIANLDRLVLQRPDAVAWTPPDQLLTHGSAAPDPLVKVRVRDAWAQIEDQLRVLRPEFLTGLNPPATEQQIAAAEGELGFSLPYDLRCSLLIHDGQKPYPSESCFFYHLLSLQQILDRYHAAADYAWGDQYYAAFSSLPSLRNDSWCVWQPDSLPVANSGIACDLYIEVATGELCHIFEESEASADVSFGDWLSGQASAIVNGHYESNAEGQFMFVPVGF